MANCANAARLHSLTNEILASAIPNDTPSLGGYTETKGANIVGAKLEHAKNYSVSTAEPLFLVFQAIRKQAKEESAILVLDNLEALFTSKPLMEELGNIITLFIRRHRRRGRIQRLWGGG